MSRDARLARLSRDHHHALTLALRIQRELPAAEPREVAALVRDVLRYWDEALVPHLAVEDLATEVRGANVAPRTGILARFSAALAAHIRLEEREILEWAQAHLDDAALDGVASAVAEALPAQAVPCPVPHLA